MPEQFVEITTLRIAFASDDLAMLLPFYSPLLAVNDFREFPLGQDALGQPIHVHGMVLKPAQVNVGAGVTGTE